MRILVVDDEQGLRHTLSLILRDEGHVIATADEGEAALAMLAESDFDLVLCDVRMPVLDGLQFLDRYRESGGRALVIMMSAYGDDDAALEAMRRGAYDYIPKPFKADQVILVIRKAMEREKLRQQVARLQDELLVARGGEGIIGHSEAMRSVLDIATKVARHASSVLITGESGTGKELVARLIHRRSPRANAPFVAVNCGAIPESLLESELFGHVKGAFTGASTDRRGLFEEAEGGTLFLDEIGELPVALQVKLLRALQEGEIRPVGGNADKPVDVRVVTATARVLEDEVAASRFRSDLYYRINVVRLHLPPLRERKEDVPALVQHFVAQHNKRLGTRVVGVSPAAMRALMEYRWPGNVRELENVVERAIVLSEGDQVELKQLPAEVRGGPPKGSTRDGDLSVKRQTGALEKSLIEQALERTGGNRTRAAELLDLSHRALLYKIREYGLGD